MKNQKSRLFIVLFIFLASLVSCNRPADQGPGGSNPPVEQPPQEEPTIQVEEPSEPVSPSEPNSSVGEVPPVGGGEGPSDEPGEQNPLPPAVNLENSAIDLEKLGKDIVGGGGGNNCSEFLAIKTEQEIILWFDGLADDWKLCFINFPAGAALVKLSTQSGMFDASINLEPEFEGVEAYALYLNLPASVIRDGPLNVEFSVEGVTSSQTFDIQTMDQINIYKDSINMLDVEYQSYPNYNFGDQIDIFGVNLLPSTTVYVGIYGVSYFDLYFHHSLIDQFQVTTNEAGEFLGAVQLTEKYRQGDYVIYYGYNSEIFENRQQDHKYDKFTVGGISPTWQPCPADYASRLRVGDVGIVSDNPPLPNNVRNNPSLSGEMIGQLQPGEKFIILDGPVCNDNWVWWYVQSDSNGEQKEAITGWTSEGDTKSYWLLKP